MFSNIIAGAAGFPVADLGDNINQSLRFKGTQDFRRIVGTTSNRKTFTVSTWVKRGALGSTQMIWANGGLSSGVFTAMRFQSTDKIVLQEYGGGPNNWIIETNALFRDTSAWYHFVLAVDTTQSTAADRVKFWVNGKQITDWGQSTYPSQNHDTYVNLSDGTGDETAPNPAVQVGIGVYHNGSSQRLDGYQAETNFLDGITAVATNFGRYQEDGVWVPKNYTGSYGTNGYRLNFANSSDLGNDVSGNNNDFTASGFDTADVNAYITQLTATVGGFPVGKANAFDGDINTRAYGDGNGTWQFAPDPAIPFDSLRIYSVGGSTTTFNWNGNSTVANTSSGGWRDLSSWGSGSISTSQPLTIVGSGGGRPELNALEVTVGGVATIITSATENDVDYKDTPTSNYATLNAASPNYNSGDLFDANLAAKSQSSVGANPNIPATIAHVTSGDWYFEFDGDNANATFGVAPGKDVRFPIGDPRSSNIPSFWFGANHVWSAVSGVSALSLTPTVTMSNHIFGIRINIDAGEVSFWAEGVSQGTYTFAQINTLLSVNLANQPISFFVAPILGGADGTRVNYGQRPFVHRPSGFTNNGNLELNNLPEPTIKNGSDHFQTILVTPGIEWTAHTSAGSATTSGLGTHTYQTSFTPSSASNQDIIFKLSQPTTSVTFDFSQALNTSFWYPGWMVVDDITTATAWINKAAINTDANGVITITDSNPFQYVKLRSLNNSSGTLTLQSVTPGIDPILTVAQATFPSGLWWIKDRQNTNQHQLVDSVRGGNLALTCPTLGGDQAYSAPSGDSVAWCWNYDSSDPSVNGFEIITYTGNATVGRTVSHNLGKAPDFIITKERNNTGNYWAFYHSGGGVGYGYLNDPLAYQHSASSPVMFTATSSTDWTYDANAQVNGSGLDYVSYAWTSVPGYSAFGKYSGNQDANGVFVYTGFAPKFLLLKGATLGSDWILLDSARSTFNPRNAVLYSNYNLNESIVSTLDVDFLSNGFKIRTNNATLNQGYDYLYSCFAENPFGGENAAPATAR